jgi:hypothetical protein
VSKIRASSVMVVSLLPRHEGSAQKKAIPGGAKIEQAFSVDGGRTWEPNWTYEVTRVKN